MKPIKMNDADNYESINIQLSKDKFPIAYQNKLQELLDYKAFDTKEEAEKYIAENPIELELYYEPGYGLFGVESEATEANVVHSPYSNAPVLDDDLFEKFNEDDHPQHSNDFIKAALTDDVLKTIIKISNDNQEIPEYKIEEIRNAIFHAISGKDLEK